MGRHKKKQMGRPSKFDDKICKQATKLCRLGATDQEIASFFEVHVDTIYEWKKKHPDFSEALKKGKELADATVANSLYRRAIGYKHTAVQFFSFQGEIISEKYIKHYPPDSVACFFWLQNRRPDRWRKAVDENKLLDSDKPREFKIGWSDEDDDRQADSAPPNPPAEENKPK